MSKETPKDDPRQATDSKSGKQTDESWNGLVEKEQKRIGCQIWKSGKRPIPTKAPSGGGGLRPPKRFRRGGAE